VTEKYLLVVELFAREAFRHFTRLHCDYFKLETEVEILRVPQKNDLGDICVTDLCDICDQYLWPLTLSYYPFRSVGVTVGGPIS